jgi:hypothetical protein
MVCITVPTSGSAANADVQTNDSLDGVHDVNTFEFVNGADDSVLMSINKENGLDINMDTVITPSNAIDPPLTVNNANDAAVFVVTNTYPKAVGSMHVVPASGSVTSSLHFKASGTSSGSDVVLTASGGTSQDEYGNLSIGAENVYAYVDHFFVNNRASVGTQSASSDYVLNLGNNDDTTKKFLQCSTNGTPKCTIDNVGNLTAHDVSVNDLTTYNTHVNGVLNVDGGLNVRNNADVPKFIVLNDGSVFAEAPFQSQSIVIQNPQETGANTYGDYIVCHLGDNDVFKVDNTAAIYGSALTITGQPDITGFNQDGDYLRCGGFLKLDCYGNTTFPKTSISNTGLISTKGNVVVTDSVGTAKVTLSTSGSLMLPNADIAATGVITTKGGISVRDSGAVEKINLSNAGVVTLPNADIASTGVITTKGGISVRDSGAVEKINLSNAGVVTLPNASISTAGVLTTKGGISVTDSGGVEKVNLSSSGTVTLPNMTFVSGGDLTANGIITSKGGVTIRDGANAIQITLSTTGAINCNAIAIAGTPTVGQVGYMKSVVAPVITEQTSGAVTTIGSLSLEAGTWILCADVLFASTAAGKTLDSCAIAISTQQVTLPNLEHGFYQTGIAMSMPTINTYYKPGTITRTYQGAATTMYLISSLLCVTPVNFIKAMAVNFTATRIA